MTERLAAACGTEPAGVIVVGHVSVDLVGRSIATRDGRQVALTGMEFILFATLALAGGAVIGRALLSEALHGQAWRGQLDRRLDQAVFLVRRKLGDGEDGLPLIRSLRGRGYWVPPEPGSPPLDGAEGLRRARDYMRRTAVAALDHPDSARIKQEELWKRQAKLDRYKRDGRRVCRVWSRPPVRSVVLLVPNRGPDGALRQVPAPFRQEGDVLMVTLPAGTLHDDPPPSAPKPPRSRPVDAGVSQRVPDPAKAIQASSGRRVR